MKKQNKRHLCMLVVVVIIVPALAYGKDHGLPVFSLSVTTPQKLSASVGYAYMFDPKESSNWVKGIMVRVEPGLAGIKGHVGPCLFGKNYWDRLFLSATLSALRTYGSPIGVEEDQTYIGGELSASFIPFLRINGGIYRHASGDNGKDWLFSAGLGIGF